jgi:hypothetical protein
MTGVRISKGMTVGIRELSIRRRADGTFEGDPVILHVLFDVCPTWIRLANRHAAVARKTQAERQVKWQSADEDTRSQFLEDEFESSMQAMVSAAIAWDALYSIVREHVEIPPAMLDRWRKGGTARYTQVAEVVRRAFGLKPKGAAALRSNLKEIFRCRDRAVHPSGKLEAAVKHPELDVGVEWRFAFYRARNADFVVSVATTMLWDLAHQAKPKSNKVASYQQVLASKLQELLPEGRPVVEQPQ